jgi:hypothetical protein
VFTWLFIAVVSLLVTPVIPAAVLIGLRWRHGAMIASAVGALAAFLTLWGISDIPSPINGGSLAGQILPYVVIYLFIAGVLLLLGGWAIALESAVSERRWGGFILTTSGALLSVGLYFIQNPFYYPCPSGFGGTSCNSNPLLTHAIFLAASLGGPAAILIYALWKPQTQRQSPSMPEGLSTSH